MFNLMDEARRQAGRALDAAGFGPQEAPFRIVAEWPGARLRAYHPDGVESPAILILPAPFKRAYIWDLLPEISAVRRCLERNCAVYVLEWLLPGPGEDGFGLADYAGRLPPAAVEAIASQAGQTRVVAMGHSLGGTFAAIFASLHPDLVKALVLIDAPLAFGEHGGRLARAVAAAPHARTIRQAVGSPVPGSAINLLSASAAPDAFQRQRWTDLFQSLGDARALKIHARVERWTLDEFPIPGQLFEDVVELLYRENLFSRGALPVGGEVTGVDRIRAPVLAVLNPPGEIVPPASITTALDRAGLEHQTLIYEGEPGPALQHVGPLVGPIAHARLWPPLLDWIMRQA